MEVFGAVVMLHVEPGQRVHTTGRKTMYALMVCGSPGAVPE